MKAVLALVIVGIFGVVGFRVADSAFDAAARAICSTYAADRGWVLTDAYGLMAGRRAFRAFPVYSCRFTDSSGSVVFVDEHDRLISPTWEYRALRLAGWVVTVAGLAAGLGVSSALNLLKSD